ncbi:hypothetical protein STAS_14228 [Striga asiatica]|uniref:Uncharacterized protein n=1 Tax=Striga asiatica TaxID=4170 RepID=A0A5A7PYW2_STRAF|nr:hypothetical protein STAS_14228 [Striga asiatica]
MIMKDSTNMASNNVQILENHEFEISNSTRFSRRYRTLSFSSMRSDSWASSHGSSSSSSSSISYFDDYPTFSPTTPLNKFKGIPFSWEKFPGIPKNQLGSMKKEYSEHLLPPPPARSSNSGDKKSNRFRRDPFFAALVECSKDGDDEHHGTNYYGTMWKGNSKNITRSLSDKFAFMNYTSCKRTCSVSEPVRPKPSHHGLIDRRSS